MRSSEKKHNENEDILIIYATKSGNAKSVASLAYKYYTKHGLNPGVYNILLFSPEELTAYKKLLVVISTHSNGMPPPSAKRFFKHLHSQEMPELPDLNFSICALGDTSYTHFCEAGKEMDRRLQELKANPSYPRVDCDADFSDQAIRWIKGTWQAMNRN